MERGNRTIDCKIIRPPQTVSEYEIVADRRVLRERRDIAPIETRIRAVMTAYPNLAQGNMRTPPFGWTGAYAEVLDDLFFRDDAPLIAVRWTDVPNDDTVKYTSFIESGALKQLKEYVRRTARDMRDSVSRDYVLEQLVALESAESEYRLSAFLSDVRVREKAGAGFMRAGVKVLSALISEREYELVTLYSLLLQNRAQGSVGYAKRQWAEILRVLQR